jgi:hypothetical protein
MQRVAIRLSIALFLILLYACADNDLGDDGGACPDYSYEADVYPIITTKCALSGCHDGSLGADKNWTDFATFQEKALSGLVKQKITSGEMPPPGAPGGSLSEEQISIISCWIDNGALDN